MFKDCLRHPAPLSSVRAALGLSVIVALSGCALQSAGTTRHTNRAGNAGSNVGARNLAEFSDSERERILAVQDIVDRAAQEHALDPSLLNGIIWVESRFDPKAKSPAGARGLMQLMPATAAYLAKRLGERSARAYDPDFNIRAGALYLAEMVDKFGDEQAAIAAYHAGPGNVKKWLDGGKPFPDYSQAYVAKVMDARARFEGVGPATVHGSNSGARDHAVASHGEFVAGYDEPLVAPDPETLPDAADIHGVPRELDYNPYLDPPAPESTPRTRPRAQPQPQPAPQPEPAPEPEPEPELFEPVFIPHPELDHDRAPPPGWRTRAAKSRPQPRTQPRPSQPTEPARPQAPKSKPDPKPEPKPEPEQPETGLGVLPDL